MKKQILFVDDESNILNGLKRMLRALRSEWDMEFAMSGAEALEIVRSKPLDLIVTDMRMPGMNGVELLQEVMKINPDIIRMVLSGHSDSELIMQSVGVTHQFVSKPCDAETLKSIITRAIQLRVLLQDRCITKAISEMDSLPSVPALFVEMREELQSSEASIKKVARIIAKDPAMTARILQLANSAFFGRRRSISDTADAVTFLGLDRIQHLFLAAHAFAQFKPPDSSAFSIEQLWEHSVSTAFLAKKIAEKEGADKEIIDTAFTTGLLHDVGKILLATKLPDRYAEAIELAKSGAIPQWKAEKQVLATTHAEIGAYLLGLWGLPDTVVEASAYHHRPSEAPAKELCVLTVLHAADCQTNRSNDAGTPAAKPDVEYLSKLLKTIKIPDDPNDFRIEGLDSSETP